MSVAIITGSAGLVGSEATAYFSSLGMDVVGIDNDMRAKFFGAEASTRWQREQLQRDIPGYIHHDVDIRDQDEIARIFKRYGRDISLIIHTAAQPSHDWAASDPYADFTVNANGTSVMLESARLHCPEAVFIFLSTNKVYGDTPNRLPLVEKETRWEIADDHPYKPGIPETMSIDHTMHSLFGASKVAADVLVQEYGRYFGMPTCSLRGGCLTGPNHSGVELHGFLSYLIKCNLTGKEYSVFGYKGKQVRDNIHSADVVAFMYQFCQKPRAAAVYNLGGGKANSCSILEAFEMVESLTGQQQKHTYDDRNRVGDHICYYSDLRKMKDDYPEWSITKSLAQTIEEIVVAWRQRLGGGRG